MNDLQPVEYSSQRILTTQQIAEAYGTTAQIVTNNFNRNKKHFIEGKHYYCLEGETLKGFQTTNHIDLSTNLVNNRKLNKLYLWTEKGAWLLAKSLNTDEAWQACEMLVDDYYRVVKELAETTQQLTDAKAMLTVLVQEVHQLPWGLTRYDTGMTEMTIPHIHECIDRVNKLLARPHLTEKQTEKLLDALSALRAETKACHDILHQDLEMNKHIDDLFFSFYSVVHPKKKQLE